MNARDDIRLNGELVELHNLATDDRKRVILESLEAVRRSVLDWQAEVSEFDPPLAGSFGQVAVQIEVIIYCVEQVRRPALSARHCQVVRQYLDAASTEAAPPRPPAGLPAATPPDATLQQLAQQVAELIKRDRT
jgi:hypothetical protein